MHPSIAGRRVGGAGDHTAFGLFEGPLVPVEGRLGDDEEREAAVTERTVGVGAREQGEHVRSAGEGAPGLRAVDAPASLAVVLGRFGASLERGDIGADIGLGDGDRDEDFAAGDFRQPLLPLLFRSARD